MHYNQKIHRGNYGTITSHFFPKNKNKYSGHWPIVCRSSWENKFCQWCDLNTNVLSWGSESFVVPYLDPTKENSEHRYFVDFTMTIKQKDGTQQKFIAEIKPYAQTLMPRKTAKGSQKAYMDRLNTYLRNMAKWKAANAAASARGYKFLLITEKNLFQKP
jgi:hypothetical protein